MGIKTCQRIWDEVRSRLGQRSLRGHLAEAWGEAL